MEKKNVRTQDTAAFTLTVTKFNPVTSGTVTNYTSWSFGALNSPGRRVTLEGNPPALFVHHIKGGPVIFTVNIGPGTGFIPVGIAFVSASSLLNPRELSFGDVRGIFPVVNVSISGGTLTFTDSCDP